jgi:pimeloyl-ACP methyl ester carboxylesterase
LNNLLEIDSKKVHVVEFNPTGEKTVIMIHGLFTNLSVFFFKIAPLLAKRHRVILYDLRGHGGSEPRPGVASMENLSADLCALMEKLDIERADLVGYSFGGAVALYTAICHPQRVINLALIDTPLFTEKNFDVYQTNNFSSEAIIDQGLQEYVKSIGIHVSPSVVRREKTRIQHCFDDGDLPEAFRRGREFFSNTNMNVLRAPTLLLYGSRSPYRGTARWLREHLANATLRVAWGDHNLPVTRARWVGHRLRQFL